MASQPPKRVRFSEAPAAARAAPAAAYADADNGDDDDEVPPVQQQQQQQQRKKDKRRVRLPDDDDDEEDEDGDGDGDGDGGKGKGKRGGGGGGARNDDDEDAASGEEAYDEDRMRELEEDGEEVEPFNLNAERELGAFDKEGNFVWKRVDLAREEDEEEEEDAWVAGESATATATSTATKPATAPTQQRRKPRDKQTCVVSLVERMRSSGETVVEAIRRAKSEALKQDLTELTSAADELMGMGVMDVYQSTREQLAQRLPMLVWQYRVRNGPKTEIHGPFPGQDMQEWRDEGFFTADANERVLVRAAANADSFHEAEWIPGESITSFLVLPPQDSSESDSDGVEPRVGSGQAKADPTDADLAADFDS